MTSLAEQLQEIQRNFAKQAPEEVQRVMEQAAAKLVESNVIAVAKNVGDTAPDFTLNNAVNIPVSLSARLTNGPVVLAFYRGHW